MPKRLETTIVVNVRDERFFVALKKDVSKQGKVSPSKCVDISDDVKKAFGSYSGYVQELEAAIFFLAERLGLTIDECLAVGQQHVKEKKDKW